MPLTSHRTIPAKIHWTSDSPLENTTEKWNPVGQHSSAICLHAFSAATPLYLYVSLSLSLSIYIYIYREREREKCLSLSIYIYIYTHSIYIHTQCIYIYIYTYTHHIWITLLTQRAYAAHSAATLPEQIYD